METKIKIIGCEDRVGKNSLKPYTKFTTDQGDMNCFEADIITALKTKIDCVIVCDVVDAKGFKNIRGYMPDINPDTVEASAPKEAPSPPKPKDNEKMASVCVSYAKDLCVAGKIELDAITTMAGSLMAGIKELSNR